MIYDMILYLWITGSYNNSIFNIFRNPHTTSINCSNVNNEKGLLMLIKHLHSAEF